jgi:tetratricopeptide (TPR) repeat protein
MILGLGWMLHRRGTPILLVAGGWFLLTLLPSLGVVLRGVTDTPVAERYLYIPSIGLCLAVGGGLAFALGRAAWRVPVVVATVALVASYAYATIERGRIWQSDLALWTDATEKVPDAGLAWLNRGMVFMGRNDSEAAIENFRRALASRGDAENRSLAHNNIGMARVRQGRLDEAEVEFRAALRERPRYETPYYGLGLVTLMREREQFTRTKKRDAAQLQAARGFFAQALALAPQYVWALARLAECDMQLADLYNGDRNQPRARAALISARSALGRVSRLDPAFKMGERGTREVLAGIEAALARMGP